MKLMNSKKLSTGAFPISYVCELKSPVFFSAQ
jgi:hypothetical protein